MERFPDDLVGDERTVVVTGVDVRDATLDHFTKHRDRFLAVFRRPEDSRTRELHRPVTHSGNGETRRQGERSARQNRFAHEFSLSRHHQLADLRGLSTNSRNLVGNVSAFRVADRFEVPTQRPSDERAR